MKIIHEYNKRCRIVELKNGTVWLNLYRNGIYLKYPLSKNQTNKIKKYGKIPTYFYLNKFIAGNSKYMNIVKDYNKHTRNKPKHESFTHIKKQKIVIRNFQNTRNGDITTKEENILNNLMLFKIKNDIENNTCLVSPK